ncbi:putative Rho GTPase-activating protein domain, Rho GTPase activation protein [Trachipleistophora hominis]|uniref:Putative Rho GTPase-activating protein domain, Rho GTPase activation protein n=1 Tax=Trachipleistophora hominis TaxID=72359 RepID=L7JVD1_TRAHO|nr:putative Rho GTPase-activating protein domain, Rho GTPase activation protein [Trachipleistophora hominis]
MLTMIEKNNSSNDCENGYERRSVKELVKFFNEKDNLHVHNFTIRDACRRTNLSTGHHHKEIEGRGCLEVRCDRGVNGSAACDDKQIENNEEKIGPEEETINKESVVKTYEQRTKATSDETAIALKGCKLSKLYEKNLNEMLIFSELKTTNVQHIKLTKKKKISVSNRKIVRCNTCSDSQNVKKEKRMCKKSVKRSTEKRVTVLDKDFIEYEKLCKFEKWRLAVYCMGNLRKMAIRENFFVKSFNFLLQLFKLHDFPRIKSDCVSPMIFSLINHLKMHGQREIGIFRLSGRLTNVQMVLNKIKAGQDVNLSTYPVRDIVSLLKIYVRNNLDGICTRNVTKILLNIFQRNTDTINKSLKYLPFIFYGDRRKLIISLFELFDEISSCEFHNKMSRQMLIRCTAPTFFSTVKVLDLSIVPTQIRVVETLSKLNFKYVPRDLYEKAMKCI